MFGAGKLKIILPIFILLSLFISVFITPSCLDTENKSVKKKKVKGKIISLPLPETKGKISLEESLYQRRSIRLYKSAELSKKQISQLLWACQGITEPSFGGRTAPSAGALYPLEVYMVNNENVSQYLPERHSLLVISNGDVRKKLSQAALGQEFISSAPVSLIITAVYERTSVKYGKRAERYVKLEAGHACQNLLLQAVALDLGAVPVGAFNDKEVQDILSIPEDHKPLYIVCVGYPAKTEAR